MPQGIKFWRISAHLRYKTASKSNSDVCNIHSYYQVSLIPSTEEPSSTNVNEVGLSALQRENFTTLYLLTGKSQGELTLVTAKTEERPLPAHTPNREGAPLIGRAALWITPDLARLRSQAFWPVLCKWLQSHCWEWFIVKAAQEIS